MDLRNVNLSVLPRYNAGKRTSPPLHQKPIRDTLSFRLSIENGPFFPDPRFPSCLKYQESAVFSMLQSTREKNGHGVRTCTDLSMNKAR